VQPVLGLSALHRHSHVEASCRGRGRGVGSGGDHHCEHRQSWALRHCVCLSFLVWAVQELLRFPSLQAELLAAATKSLEQFRESSRKLTMRLVDMEGSYLTVEFFRRLPGLEDSEEGGRPHGQGQGQGQGEGEGEGSGGPLGRLSSSKSNRGSGRKEEDKLPTVLKMGERLPTGADRYQEFHFRRIGQYNTHCTVLYSTVLYCTVLYCNVLYCTVLYCTVLYCTVLSVGALLLPLAQQQNHEKFCNDTVTQ